MQVVLVKPDRFEDVSSIADHLNDKKTVVLNLEACERDVSRRIIDFLSGVAYANHGNIRKVAVCTFIIVPYDVDVMGEVALEDFDESRMYF
jgi:cell division inhibitor SepF